MRLSFSRREVRDLVVAWVALGVAFALFFEGGAYGFVSLDPATYAVAFVGSLLTVGVGFLLHELAHKIVAVRFGQVAEFHADYGMLFLAVAGGIAGFVFAAPGAVHHRGYLTEREHGLIAIAGPVTNVVLALAFVPLVLVSPTLGTRGVGINLLLAAFNMLPAGPLDGRTVWRWSPAAHLAVFVPSAVATLALFFPGLVGLA